MRKGAPSIPIAPVRWAPNRRPRPRRSKQPRQEAGCSGGQTFADGKLTAAAAERVVRQAADMAERFDYRSQCALAGPELTFKITDHSTAPASVHSGGRREICAAQRESAQAVDAMQLRASVCLGKLAITLNPDSTRATVKYETATTLTHQGEVLMVVKCA